MDRFTLHSLALVGPGCKQTQIYVGYGPSGDNGSDNLSTFPVNLSTPLASGSDISNISLYSDGPATWLANSSMDTISLPVPLGVPLDFGVLGGLAASSTAAADGTQRRHAECFLFFNRAYHRNY